METDIESYISGRGALRVGDSVLDLEVTVPAVPVPVRRLLPILQGLTDQVVRLGIEAAARAGREVSCRAGCGACCDQLVPISVPEALDLRDLVETFPEPRRTQVKERFQAALDQLDQQAFLDRLRSTGDLDADGRLRLGLEYFELGIPCPFLEDGSCSVYLDRPLVCREYLVSSPAANCRKPSPETIECIEIPGSFSQQLRNVASDPPEWLPLILLFQAPENEAQRSGPEWLSVIFGKNLQPGSAA